MSVNHTQDKQNEIYTLKHNSQMVKTTEKDTLESSLRSTKHSGKNNMNDIIKNKGGQNTR